jgi:hypothetical protein
MKDDDEEEEEEARVKAIDGNSNGETDETTPSSARRSASTEPSMQHEHDDLDTTAVSEMNSEEAVGEVLLTGTDG